MEQENEEITDDEQEQEEEYVEAEVVNENVSEEVLDLAKTQEEVNSLVLRRLDNINKLRTLKAKADILKEERKGIESELEKIDRMLQDKLDLLHR